IGPLPPCWGGLERSKAPPPPAGEGWGEGKPVGHQTLCHEVLVEQAIYRSLMFVPGSSEKMLTKAIGLTNLDVAMFDLEDGVTPQLKDEARKLVAATLASPPGGPMRYVRINAVPSDWFEPDMEALVRPGLEGLALPKVEE